MHIAVSNGEMGKYLSSTRGCLAWSDCSKVHESIRSENVLFSPTEHGGTKLVNYGEPWLFGFNFSRPESYFSDGLADYSPVNEIYRHPERQGRPEKPFMKVHDIYSLGVILLEIGAAKLP